MKAKYIYALSIACIMLSPAFSQDRNFAYNYQSTVLNKGQRDFEVWNTYKTGRAELFRQLDQRLEFEVGLTSKLQTSFYLNSSQKTYQDSAVLITEPAEISFSNEWKFKLTDPVANGIGSALYVEVGLASHEYDLELKLILDKKIDRHMLVANLVSEFEYETEMTDENGEFEVDNELEILPEIDLGYQYLIKDNFGIGLEAVNRNVMKEGELEHSALFGGPTVFYGSDRWWLIFNTLPQITAIKSENNESLDLNEFQKYEFRLLFAYMFN